jgi:hypothetical protein
VFGLNVKVGAGGTLNVALAASPVGVPVTITEYAPLDPVATVNEPDSAPPATVHSGVEINPLGDEVIEHPVSPGLAKFVPVTRTFVPARPEAGSNERPGMTVKLAVPLSPSATPVRVRV